MTRNEKRLQSFKNAIAKKINPKLLVSENSKPKEGNLFLVLALMMNDLSDLIDLHDLFIEATPPPTPEINAENGIYYGKSVYLDRLLLSHLYEVLYFFKEHSAKLDSGLEMRYILQNLSDETRKRWVRLKKMSEYVDKPSLIDKSDFNQETKEILKLSLNTRHATYHYHTVESTIRPGFRNFFFKMVTPGNKHAYFIDESNFTVDRALYIDAAIQVGLTKNQKFFTDAGIRKELMKIMIEATAFLNLVISGYHQYLKKK